MNEVARQKARKNKQHDRTAATVVIFLLLPVEAYTDFIVRISTCPINYFYKTTSTLNSEQLQFNIQFAL